MPDHATVAQLKAEINRVLNIPAEDMALSKDPKLVRAATSVGSICRLGDWFAHPKWRTRRTF